MPSDTPQPRIVLVRPQMGENIGAAARAMWNFELDRMHMVAPRDGWPNPAANAMASGAGRLLDEALVHDTLAEAVGDCTYVLATTARPRELTKPVLSPERAMAEACARIGAGEKVALVFGPERAGLENAEIARADAIVSVPVNPVFASLNLAQCVLLMGYEWRRQSVEIAHEINDLHRTDWASALDVEKMGDHYEERLEEAGFFFPEHKADGMKVNLRNLWSRMRLTRADVRMMHGIMRQMVRWKERGE